MLQTIELQGGDREEQVRRLRLALREGCCYIAGSPLVRDDGGHLLRRCLAHLDEFYRLPVEDKLRLWTCTASTVCHRDAPTDVGNEHGGANVIATGLRGYFPLGSESGDVQLFERKESFAFGCGDARVESRHPHSASALIARNVWPDGWCPTSSEHSSVASPSEDLEELHSRMCDTAKELLPLIEAALPTSLPSLQEVAVDSSSDIQSFLRSFRYYGTRHYGCTDGVKDPKAWVYPRDTPETRSTRQQLAIGSSLHTDWNLLTLVWASSKGLQMARSAGGDYEDVHPLEELHLICNFGDFLSSFSKGAAVSPWHRVLSPACEGVRDSLVFFFYPSAMCPAITEPVYNLGRPLSLFTDQSQAGGELWDIAASGLDTMAQVYAAKWKQVSKEQFGSSPSIVAKQQNVQL